MSRKAICPMCGTLFKVPPSFSIYRSRPGHADRVYFYHRRPGGGWCLSNGAKIARKRDLIG